MMLTCKQFDSLMDDDDWKTCFMDGRSSDIVIVRCKTKRMNNFWKHAIHHHVVCNDIDDALSTIESHNKIIKRFSKSKFVYYKVFIRSGYHKMIVNNENCCHRFNYANCSIEILGNNHPTISIIDRSEEGMLIVCPQYLSMKDIIFDGNILDFCKHNYDDIDNNITASTLHISNCSFVGTKVSMDSIDNIIIENCVFTNASQLDIKDNPIPNYNITGNTFADGCNVDIGSIKYIVK